MWLLINLKGVIEDEHLVRIWGSQIDITERKLAEQALNESEQKYRALVEQANDGITVIQDEKIVFANKRFAEMTGRTFVGLLDTPFNDY